MLHMEYTYHNGDRIYHQGNEPIHCSRLSMWWFKDNNVCLLPWPENTPVLNRNENLWGILKRRVYANFKCFRTVSELKEVIQVQWHEIDILLLQTLVGCMGNRWAGVVEAFGGPFKYWIRLLTTKIKIFLLVILNLHQKNVQRTCILYYCTVGIRCGWGEWGLLG